MPYNPILANKNNATHLSVFFIIFGVFLVISSLVTGFMAMLNGIDIIKDAELLYDFSNPEIVDLHINMQIVGSIIVFIIPALIVSWLIDRSPIRFLNLNVLPTFLTIIATAILIFSLEPLISFTGLINSKLQLPEWLGSIQLWMEQTEQTVYDLTREFLRMENTNELIFSICLAAVLPAIAEELVFRGLMQRFFIGMTKKPIVGILITAFIFSAYHMQFFGFLPRFILGLVLGYLFYWSKSLWLPILAHFFNNAYGVILTYYIGIEKALPDMTDPDITVNYWFLAGGTSAAVLLMYFIYRKEKLKKSIINI